MDKQSLITVGTCFVTDAAEGNFVRCNVKRSSVDSNGEAKEFTTHRYQHNGGNFESRDIAFAVRNRVMQAGEIDPAHWELIWDAESAMAEAQAEAETIPF